MKRLVTIPLISLVLIAAMPAIAPTGIEWLVAHAQDFPDSGGGSGGSGGGSQGGPQGGPQLDSQLFTEEEKAAGVAALNNAAQAPSPSKKNFIEEAIDYVMLFIMKLFAWLVGVALLTLEYAMYYTVVNMGAYVKNLDAIGLTWTVLRDIGNIMLIFGFLAVGVTTILNVDWYGGGKKMLPMMLVAAVFLNFSLFITEAIIDTGNLFAVQFYKQISGGSIAAPNVGFGDITSLGQRGIAGAIMSKLGLAAIYGQMQDPNIAQPVFSGGQAVLIGFMSILLFVVLAFVLFSLAFVLIARFVILIFLIILAPVGFAGLAVPQMRNRAKQWWDKLFEQTLTAPILLLMLYVALKVITDTRFLSQSGDWIGFIENKNLGGFASILLAFLVAMGLLIAVVIQSKNLSAFGASLASKAAGNLSFGAVSLAGRTTLGGAGLLFASKRVQSWARKGGWGHVAKVATFAGKGLSGLTYDFRNMPGAGIGLGALGIDAGKGATLTARQAHEAKYGWKPIDTWMQQAKEERERVGREIDFEDALGNISNAKLLHGNGAMTDVEYKNVIEENEKIITSALAKMSTKELEQLDGIKKGMDELVQNLSPQQFEALMKSDKLSDEEKGEIKKSRYHPLKSAIDSRNRDEVKKIINAFSKGELESMPSNTLESPLVLEQLSDKQRETLTDSKERTAAEKDMVRKASPVGGVEAIFDRAGGGVGGALSVAVSPEFARLTVPQIVKLKKEILLEEAVAGRLTSAVLVKLQDENKLSPGDMATIGDAIRRSPYANAKTKDYVTTGPGAALWA